MVIDPHDRSIRSAQLTARYRWNEELEKAEARGAKIYGEVIGHGATGDAGHITQPAEDGVGAAENCGDTMLAAAGFTGCCIDGGTFGLVWRGCCCCEAVGACCCCF